MTSGTFDIKAMFINTFLSPPFSFYVLPSPLLISLPSSLLLSPSLPSTHISLPSAHLPPLPSTHISLPSAHLPPLYSYLPPLYSYLPPLTSILAPLLQPPPTSLTEGVAVSLGVNPSQCAGLLRSYLTQHGPNYPWTIGT